jgi:acetyl esterase/lipase
MYSVLKKVLVPLVLVMVWASGCATPLKQTAPPQRSATVAAPEQRPPQTAVLAAITVARFDIPYGSAPLQKLDVYAPSGVSGAPVVMFVHGGEWAKNDKSMVSYKPKFLNEHGIVFVSANYRLSPPAVHPDHVNDVAASVRWVYDHIAEYGGSPSKIFIMGHSAGCHLVTLAGLDPRPLAMVGLKPGDLSGVIAWSGGAYDLVQKVNDGGMYAGYIKKAFGDREAGWRDASPVNHAKDTTPLPPYLFVSYEASNPSHLASQRLASLIKEAGGRAETKLIENRTHFTANHLLGAPEDQTGRLLLDFIERNGR